ncbi:uncharacterized protein [Miscanthus floridulus]|uniref:uncharacterized protein n=1 Tax=Miscanthus floridulus TaxID=154761 RepID=UPI003459DE75
MEDDWIFLGDGTGSGTDSASDDDDDSGFTIVRRGRKGGDQFSVVVSDDAPALPRVAAVAVPQPTPPGLSFKVVSYAEAFSASAYSSSEDGGGRELMPGCNDEATAGKAIILGAGIDDAAGTGSTDDCTVTCKEGCESGQVAEHDGTGSSAEAPSVAVAAAPTVNCPETTAPVLYGEAHPELASGMDQGGAEEVEDEDSESCEEDDDDDTENSSEDEEDTDSSSEDEDEDTFSSSDEEYTESFSEEEYTAEIYSEEEEEDNDLESSGEEEEEEGSESCVEVDYVESSAEESHDADNTGGEEDDDSEVSGEEQEEEHDDAECSDEVDDVESIGEEEDAESTGEEEGDDDPEISCDDDVECSGEEDDVESSGDKPADPESSGADSDDDAESSGEEEEEEEEEEEDTVSSGEEEESSHVVDVAENGKKDIFAMLFPRATAACGANAEQGAANANGAVKERSESFPSKYYNDMNTDSSGSDMDTDSSDSGSDMDTDSSDMEDDDCLESDEEDDIADVAENGNQHIFDKLFPKAKACGANMDDYEEEEEEDGSLFDMLLPRDCAINDDIDSSDGEDEAATATVACAYSAEPSHGTRRPEFAVRTARGYDDVDTDSDMEDGDGEVAADVNGTSLYDWPRARATTGGGVESQCWGFACQSQTERQALWEDLRRVLEDLRRQLAAEAFESSGQQQQRSYDDVDDTCDVPGTAAPGGGPAGSCTCAPTPEAQFTARSVRDTEQELAMEEARRREAAQQELDRALAREAAPAAEALASALEDCATAERQATGDVTRPAVAKRDVPADFTFIIGVYVFVFLVVSLLSLALPSN